MNGGIRRCYYEILHRISLLSTEDEDTPINEESLSITEDGIPIRKLFVGNLARRTTYKDLEKVFSKYGKLDSCYLKRNTGRSNYAFVTFNNVMDALRARVDGYRKEIYLHNRDLRVMPADSWHQPDSIENMKELSCIKEKTDTDESGDDQSTQNCSSEEVTPIHLLNDDCLMHVFHYLPIIDRVRVERVCKRWRAVSLVAWRDFRYLDISASSWGFSKSTKKKILDTPTLRKILLRCGRFLNHIDFSLYTHRLSQSTVTVIGRFCPNLQSIDLTSLNVSASGILSLASSCTNITRFSFGSCTYSCDNDLLQLFDRNKQLKSLQIISNSMTGKCLLHLPPDSIEDITLTECNGVSPCHFLNAIQKFHKLNSLTLQTCVSITDSVIQALQMCAGSLEKLELSGYFPLLSSQALKYLADLTNLQKLDVGQNVSVTDDCLIAISDRCKELKYLDINGCQAVTDKGIAGLLALRKLETLIISYLGKVTDQYLGNMFSLKILECRGCPGIMDDGLRTLVLIAPQLELLDLSGCDNVSNSWISTATRCTKSRMNGIILKVYIGGTNINVKNLTATSPFLQIVNVDLSSMFLRPDFEHVFFPEENLSISDDEEGVDRISEYSCGS